MAKRKHFIERRSWSENCTPNTIDELAVHPKKIAAVEEWLRNSLRQKKAATLLLTGPPGAGKTATITVLCKSVNAELFSWQNSELEDTFNQNVFTDEFSRGEFFQRSYKKENQATAFSSFLLRSNRYSLSEICKRVILVEEFPNRFFREPDIFHDILRKYYSNGRHPVVFIISDNSKGENVESRLFPIELKKTLAITTISFNPVSLTKVMKVLTKINDSAQFGSNCTRLNKGQLEGIAADCMGDIRNAINSLLFLSASSGKKLKPISKSKANKDTTSTDLQRDQSIFLFHALGKILYCKRDASLKSEKDCLPPHMKHLEKDPTLANAEDVFDRASLSAEAFALFLQENFLFFLNDINSAAESTYWFSEADVLSSDWSARDTMKNYSASIAARGLMFNMNSTTKNTWRPLHKPQYYSCIKKERSLVSSVKRAFRDKQWSYRELRTDLIPYLHKIRDKSLNIAQMTVVSELGEMKIKRLFKHENQVLNEKEIFDSEINETEEPAECVNEKLELVQELEDEEVVIEEYDF